MDFLIGFVGMGGIGFIASMLVGAIGQIQAANKRMTSPPKPALSATPGTKTWAVNTDPNKSPVAVLNDGCLKIVLNLLLIVTLLLGTGFAIAVLGEHGLLPDITQDTLAGAFYAGLLGLLLGVMHLNWRQIGNLRKKMTNPPTPTFPFREKPNVHRTSAKPANSPQEVVFQGCFEIAMRLMFQVALVGALLFSIWRMLGYWME
jgi:hypothetical protein